MTEQAFQIMEGSAWWVTPARLVEAEALSVAGFWTLEIDILGGSEYWLIEC